ncbi:unnamed protein product [Linum tenue]|uniref:Hcy-binding domain-containing protein n=1 Tax=Linum tenue TaxID=586396 RepID=A0AAV0RP75_9ROSI|nr:unnamed protein product [Linum tenue]
MGLANGEAGLDVLTFPTTIVELIWSSLNSCSGNYGEAITLQALKDFRRRRLQILANSGADLLALETILNKLEAQAYAELLEEEAMMNTLVWFSFSWKDGVNVLIGDSIKECASIADSCKQVVVVGINCTPPRFIHDLIVFIRKVVIGFPSFLTLSLYEK